MIRYLPIALLLTACGELSQCDEKPIYSCKPKGEERGQSEYIGNTSVGGSDVVHVDSSSVRDSVDTVVAEPTRINPGNDKSEPTRRNPGNDKPVGKSKYDGKRGEEPSSKVSGKGKKGGWKSDR